MALLNDGDGYRALLAAVIDRALDDIKGIILKSKRRDEPDRAMYFILSETCESYCFFLGVDYEAVKEKASALYRQELEKEPPEFKIKKSPVRGAKRLKRPHTRQSPGKLHGTAYR